MAKIKNKEIIQSYILTNSKYDFSVYEKRILYRIIELNQNLLEGKTLDKKYILNLTQHGNMEYTLPIRLFLKENDTSNHKEVKKAFENLKRKEIFYDDGVTWASLNIIGFPVISTYNESISFTIPNMVYNALLDFSKGFKKYELKVAMQFESTYSMRFYELLSNQKTPINYSIDKLKEMFQVTDKYKLTANFINKVVVPAKKELDKCSPYTFHYEPIKTGRAITSIRFIPIYQPQFEDDDLKRQRLNKQISNRWFIPKNIEDYLTHNFEFTNKELKNNLNLFESLYNNLTEEVLLDFLAEIREPSSYADNRKAFVIGALKKKAEQVFTEKYM